MNSNDEIEIDLLDLCRYMMTKWVYIVVGMMVFGGIAFGYTKIKKEPVYTSVMKFYVTLPKTSDKVLIRDNASELTADYIGLTTTDLIFDKVAKAAEVSEKEAESAILAEAVVGTRIFTVTVATNQKQKTIGIANATQEALVETITKDLKKDKPIVAEAPKEPGFSESMSLKKNTIIGTTIGFILVAGIFFVVYLVKDSKEKAIA